MKQATPQQALQIVAVFALLAVGPAAADTYIVDRLDDSTIDTCSLLHNDCALRGAIIKANQHVGDDIVNLGTGTYTLTITGVNEDLCQTGDLDVHGTLVIEGEGPERTFINGAGIDRVLHMLAPGERLTVRGVTITGGRAWSQSGGGIYVSQGGLRLEGCVVSHNDAPDGSGGGIYDNASDTWYGVRIYDSWIAWNTSGGTSAVYSTSDLTIRRSTLSSNSGGYSLVIGGDDSWVIDSTVSNNAADASGGVLITASGARFSGCTLTGNSGVEIAPVAGTNPTLTNTVVVGSCNSAVTSSGGNLESPGDSCGFGASDLVNIADAKLSDLGWFGGPTPVHRPLPGSPLIDRSIAAAGCGVEDQRSLTRPRDGGGSAAAVCDIGAVELAGAGELFVETFESGFLSPWSVVVP